MHLFGIFIPKRVAVLFGMESLVLLLSYVCATLLFEDGGDVSLVYDGGLWRELFAVAVIHVALYYSDMYERIALQSYMWLVQQLSLAIGLAFLVQSLVSYLRISSLVLPQKVMIVGSALAFLGSAVLRILFSNFVLARLAGEKVILVGFNQMTKEVAEHFREHREVGFQVYGFVEPTEPVTGGFSQFRTLDEALGSVQPDLILVGLPENNSSLGVYGELLDLKYRQIRIEKAEAVYERIFGRVLIHHMTVSDMLYSVPVRSQSSLSFIQTIYSMLIAVVGTILTAPLMLIAASMVRFTSEGPILFRQKRTGLNGREFTLYKFRSMYVNSDGVKAPTKGDPRITPVGLFLRKSRLDELPQFFNVLKGDMHIVGPRPEIPQLVKVYTEKVPLYSQRLLVKPGITGWAQINHKDERTIEDTIRKLGFDLYYIKNMSLSFDIWNIFHTLKTMVLGKGAR
jgi:exopolysaccharide biosynthesis polyprenyl glycosylphosphotransferase